MQLQLHTRNPYRLKGTQASKQGSDLSFPSEARRFLCCQPAEHKQSETEPMILFDTL